MALRLIKLRTSVSEFDHEITLINSGRDGPVDTSIFYGMVKKKTNRSLLVYPH